MKFFNLFKKTKNQIQPLESSPTLSYSEVMLNFQKENKRMIDNVRGYNRAYSEYHKSCKAIVWCPKGSSNYHNYQAYISGLREALEPFELISNRRYKHLAYSLLRGKKYKEVENKTKEGNRPSLHQIEMEVQKYFPEAICKWSQDKAEIILEGLDR